MLLRPPHMQQEDVRSQSSAPYSHTDKQKSIKSTSKSKKKENSLGRKSNNQAQMERKPQNQFGQFANNRPVQKQPQQDNASVHSVNSRKSKGKSKQSTLAIGKQQSPKVIRNAPTTINNYQSNETTQNQPYQVFKLDSDEDDKKSVGSHASRNSHNRKNKKKQNTLGIGNNRPMNQQAKNTGFVPSLSPRNQLFREPTKTHNNAAQRHSPNERSNISNNNNMYEQSTVQQVHLENPKIGSRNSFDDQPPEVVKYNQVINRAQNVVKTNNVQQTISGVQNHRKHTGRRTERVQKKPEVISPFEEITLKRADEQEEQQEPIFVLKEPSQDANKQQSRNIFGQKNNEKKPLIKNQQPQKINPRPQISKNQNQMKQRSSQQYINNLQITQSKDQTEIMGNKSALGATKSRRNKIFENGFNNSSVANNSNVISSRSNLDGDGSFQRSRSKSKSKLGGLLKESREKKAFSKDKQESIALIKMQSENENKRNIQMKEQRLRQQQQRQRKQQQEQRIQEQRQQKQRQSQKRRQQQIKQQQKRQQQKRQQQRRQQSRIQQQRQQKLQQQQRQQQKQTQQRQVKSPLKPVHLTSENKQRIPDNNNSNLYPNSYQNSQFKTGGNKLGQNFQKMKPIQRNSTTQDNQVFDLGESQHTDLNLSCSHKLGHQPSGFKGDSVHFHFEPEKRKGISILSRQKQGKQGTQLQGNVQSKKYLDRISKKYQQNEEFLAKSLLTNSELRSSRSKILSKQKVKEKKEKVNKISSPSPVITRANSQNTPHQYFQQNQQNDNYTKQRVQQQQSEDISQPEWHQLVMDQQRNPNAHMFKIKEVQRKQTKKPIIQEERTIQQRQPKKQPNFFQEQQASPVQGKFIIEHQQKEHNRHSQNQNIQTKFRSHQIRQNRQNRQANKNRQNRQNTNNNNDIMLLRRQQQQKQKRTNYKVQNQNGIEFVRQPQSAHSKISAPKQKMMTSKPRTKQSSLGRSPSMGSSIASISNSQNQNGSQRSRSISQKKTKKKESTLGIMKQHKVQVRQQSPRAQQSFYQERQSSKKQIPIQSKVRQMPHQSRNNQNVLEIQSMANSKKSLPDSNKNAFKLQSSKAGKIQYKKPKVIDFYEGQSEPEMQSAKSKTDSAFYNFGGDASQKSMRPPSSKPPLSKRSNASSNNSRSKPKTKQSTINVNMNKKQNPFIVSNQNKKPATKKRTLLDLADDKSYEGSGYGGQSNSQCSFDSRQSLGSVNSRGSRKSSGSRKQSTLPITVKSTSKNKTFQNSNNAFQAPSLTRIQSANSQVQIFDKNQTIYERLKQQSSRKDSRDMERSDKRAKERTVVSKDTYFIDERGRLVKQDLVIKGKDVYGRPALNDSADRQAYDRMRRSREQHRSRSKSRQGNGSSSRITLSRKNSGSSNHISSSGYESASNYMQNSQATDQYYDDNRANRNGSIYLQEFIKPIQQPSQSKNYQKSNNFNNSNNNRGNSRKIENQFYQNQQEPYQSYYDNYEDNQPVRNTTLNELFGKDRKQQLGNSKVPNYNPNNSYGNNNFSRNGQGRGILEGSNVSTGSRKRSMNRTEKSFYNNNNR